MQQLLARTRRSKRFSKQGLPGILSRSPDEEHAEVREALGFLLSAFLASNSADRIAAWWSDLPRD